MDNLFLSKEIDIFNNRIHEINALRNKIQLLTNDEKIEVKNAVNVDLFKVYDFIESLNVNREKIIHDLDKLIETNIILTDMFVYILNLYRELENSNYNKKVDSKKYADILVERSKKR